MVVKTATYVTSKNFEEKQFFFEIEHDCKLLRTSRWKKRASSQKIFLRFFTTGIRDSREMSWGKMICLSKKFYFSVIIFGVWVIYLSLLKIFWSGVKNHRSACGDNKIVEINLKNLFFLTILDFDQKKLGLSAKQ